VESSVAVCSQRAWPMQPADDQDSSVGKKIQARIVREQPCSLWLLRWHHRRRES
jgi:hypothetical protein